MKNFLLIASLLFSFSAFTWEVLDTVPFRGKQDDIFFVSPLKGWYVNGKGFIYGTSDGGASWQELVNQPGTYFRAIGFVDENVGFAGNIGPDYFPGVTDSRPLYQTNDGGKTWTAALVSGEEIKGVCAIDVLKTHFINAGVLDTRHTIFAAGRVGGPAALTISKDLGKSWKTQDLSPVTGMIQDVKFLDERVGFVCTGSHYDLEQSHAQILKTKDGGLTWKVVYESTRPFELTWKCSFPSKSVGYATVQSYDPDPSRSQRYVAKTTDGGETWKEIPLVNDFSVREFGVGFLDEKRGWVGAIDGGFYTADGGETWTHQSMGKAVNKIRVVPTEKGHLVFAIGFDVRKLVVE